MVAFANGECAAPVRSPNLVLCVLSSSSWSVNRVIDQPSRYTPVSRILVVVSVEGENRAVRFDCFTHGGSIRVSRHCPALTDSVSARKLGIASFSFQVGRSKQGRRTTIATHCAKKSHKLCLYFGTQYGCCQDLVELIEFNVVIVHPRPAISSLPTTNQTFISAIRSSKVTLA